jgi:hypothetical protein
MTNTTLQCWGLAILESYNFWSSRLALTLEGAPGMSTDECWSPSCWQRRLVEPAENPKVLSGKGCLKSMQHSGGTNTVGNSTVEQAKELPRHPAFVKPSVAMLGLQASGCKHTWLKGIAEATETSLVHYSRMQLCKREASARVIEGELKRREAPRVACSQVQSCKTPQEGPQSGQHLDGRGQAKWCL